MQEQQTFGTLLRKWRDRRALSQLALAAEAEISQRHLSFIESGRSQPSREMILRLAERLRVPVREQNLLLTSAGYAPVFPEHAFDDPGFAAARHAVEAILNGHEPHPALAVDRHWTLLASNKAVAVLLSGINADLLKPPVNVLRLSLHPAGLAPRIVNYREWRAHIIARLLQQIDVSADQGLAALLEEIKAYPMPANARHHAHAGKRAAADIAVPFRLEMAAGTLSFLSTTTVFGTAVDITLSELTIETFFPADPETAQAMRKLIEAEE
jgi:transcriptional regulator with XRE-family HTH domain